VKGERCLGSAKFPTNFDGKLTRCPACKRQFKLPTHGRIPVHSRIHPKETKERLPGVRKV